MSEKKNVASNTFFYFAYQCILFVVPLIVMPHLTRVFSESILGEYTFSYSVAYYFVLGANLGISTYGQREIASEKDNIANLKNKFWSLFYVHLVFSTISFFAYVLFFTISSQVSLYSFIIPYVISAAFDVTWFFYGLENFKLVTIINALLSIIKMILIFSLVKNDNSLWVYQLISFGAVLISQIIIFVFALRIIGRPKIVRIGECVAHLKPILYFALAAIALTLYTYVDKTLLGIMIPDAKKSVAFYECADKIVAVPRMLITVLSTVLYPKMCFMTKNNDSKIGKYTIFSIDWTTFLSLGSIFGLFVLSVPLSVLYYGQSYFVSGYCMILMCPLIYIISIGSICRTQYILPQKKDKIFLIAISLNAIINLILNALLIPLIGIYGVVIASIVSESVALVYQLFYCRKMFPFKHARKAFFVHLMSAFIMFCLLLGITKYISISRWSELILMFFVGLISYIITLLAISPIFNYKSTLFSFIKKR